MRLGIISDVHCAAPLLAYTAELMVADGVDEILLAGDAHYEYRFSNDVVDLIRQYGMRYILGNHEQVLLGPHGERARSGAHVGASNLAFVAESPLHVQTTIDGRSLLMTHGNPWPPYNKYLNKADPDFARLGELGVDYLVTGHTHVPLIERVGPTLVINPGSLAFSRDPGGSDLLTYALLDTSTDEVVSVRTPKSEIVLTAAAESA